MEPPSVTGDRLGLVVGSGLGDIAPLLGEAEPRRVEVSGSGGRPTEVTVFDRASVVVLPRHGGPPSVPAHLLDHHANIGALCLSGCSRVVGVASVGSLRTDWHPGTIVAPDDFFAPAAHPTFFDDTRGHRIPAFDPEWRDTVVAAWRESTGTPINDGGVYAETTGPRFETPAEVRMLARHADLVGMTVASEAVLAGEAGLSYAALCKVDNLANGLGAAPLTMEEYATSASATRSQLLADLVALLGWLTRR